MARDRAQQTGQVVRERVQDTGHRVRERAEETGHFVQERAMHPKDTIRSVTPRPVLSVWNWGLDMAEKTCHYASDRFEDLKIKEEREI
jgi:hypothetical protein